MMSVVGLCVSILVLTLPPLKCKLTEYALKLENLDKGNQVATAQEITNLAEQPSWRVVGLVLIFIDVALLGKLWLTAPW